jgi:hypothetical protein
MRYLVLTASCLLLAACGQRDTDPGPGGVSVGEARALDQAAALLDRQRLPEGTLSSRTPAATQRAPTPAPAPSHSPSSAPPT